MDPMTAMAIAQGGSSIFSSIMGRGADNSAARNQAQLMQMQVNETANQNALRNYYMNRAYSDQKLGSTNAMGDRVSFVPGVGEVVTLSDGSRTLLNASNDEQLKRLTVDSPMARSMAQRNYTRTGTENAAADETLRQLMSGPTTSKSDLEAMFRTRMRKDAGEGFDQVQNNSARTALRTGTDNSKSTAKIAKQRGEAYANIGNEAALQATSAYDTMEGNRVNRGSSLYNLLASRAAGNPNTTFTPFDTSGINADLSAQQGRTTQVGQNMGFAPMGNFNGVSAPGPNYADANMWNGIGAGVEGIGTALSTYYKNRQNGNSNSGYSDKGWANFLGAH